MKISSHLRFMATSAIIFSFLVMCQQTLATPLHKTALNEKKVQLQLDDKANEAITPQAALAAYNIKDYSKALSICEKLAPNDNSGWSQFEIALMNQNGQGTKRNLETAISWYKIVLEKTGNESLYATAISNMGLIYSQSNEKVAAFEYFLRAAKMGNSYAELQVAARYTYGVGTIQDYKKAYAWTSVAIAVGGVGKKNQNLLKQLKVYVRQQLVIDGYASDRANPMKSLHQAQTLAKQYYKLYVLHESPQTNKPKDFSSRIGAAIKALEN